MSDFQAFNAVTHPIVRLNDDWNKLLDHGLVKNTDYIIRQNGTNYEAISGSTGNIFISNADATNVIQAVFNQNPSKVYIGAMDVTLTAPLLYPAPCIIECAGMDRTILRSAIDDYIFKPASVAVKRGFQLRDLTIVFIADGVSQGGILLDGTLFATIDNIRIGRTAVTNVNLVGIKITDSALVGSYFNQIRNCDFGATVGGGVQTGLAKGIYFAPSGGWDNNVNTIIGGRFQNNTIGIHIENGNKNWVFNTDFEGNGTAIKVHTYNNGVLGSYFELNTIDIETVDANSTISVFGPIRDLKITETGGTVLFISPGYGDTYNAGFKLNTGSSHLFMYDYIGITFIPGVVYVNFGTSAARVLDLFTYRPRYARLNVTCEGNEAGAGKGIEIYDDTAGISLCDYTWDGLGLKDQRVGAWYELPVTAFIEDSVLRLRFKGSSPTEQISLWYAELQFK